MHPLTSSFALYSPSSRSESSFPERHLDSRESDWPSHDDMTHFSSIDLNYSQPALPRTQTFDQSFWSQGWVGQSQPLLGRSHIPSHPVAIEHPPVLQTSYRATITTSPVQAEWDLFRNPSAHSPGGIQWDMSKRRQNAEDDSDSISVNDSLEEFCPPLSTWSATHKVRRRSTHRISKPSRFPSTQTSLHVVPSSKRHVNAESSPDVVDFSDTHMFHSQLGQDNIILSPDSAAGDFTFHEEPLSSKLHSKRVAHKLSEKSRRNRLTVAIREIQKLLPSDNDREDSPQQDNEILIRPGVPSSKLDVVEMTIGFIKRLKEENAEMTMKVKELEEKQAQQQCRCQQEEKQDKAEDTNPEPQSKETVTE
ncbi:hypothetical protein QBC43DRAFT_213693 [Cladorrhinum sp. PSN259]|nr:hypothetical protein QBC43DRAFT_213693 [Cladorrhinum sp. PSN259]